MGAEIIILIALWGLVVISIGLVSLRIFGGVNHRRVVRHLALLLNHNLPLTTGLYLAARGEPSRTQSALRRIMQLLEAGLPLGEALRRGHWSCPSEIVTTVQAAEAAGTLPAALVELDARLSRQRPSLVTPAAHAWAYAAVVGIVLLSISSFTTYFTLPKLAEIFKDYNTPLPRAMTRIFLTTPIAGKGWTVFAWPLLIGLVIVAVDAAALLIRLVRWIKPRRGDNPSLFTRLFDEIRWQTPFLRKSAMARALEAQLPMLDLALAAGWPLPDAVDIAADVDANNVWRNRLRQWASRLRRGEDVVQSARDCGFPELVLNALRSGVREGDLRPGLRYCQEYYESYIRHWRLMLRSLTLPLVTIGLGVMVGLCAVAFIGSLAAIIDDVCRQIG